MGLDSCMKCIKYTLFIFNFFFWLVGVVLLGLGLYLLIAPLANAGYLLEDGTPFRFVSLTFIVIGSIIMLLGFLGCCGAILENKCMLLTFFVLMTLVFLALVVSGLLVVFMHAKAKEHFSKGFEDYLETQLVNYKNVSSSANDTDAQHRLFKCCGIKKGRADFTERNIPVPESCKVGEDDPCVPKLEQYMESYRLPMTIVIFSVAAVTLIGMVLSMMLCCALRDEYDY